MPVILTEESVRRLEALAQRIQGLGGEGVINESSGIDVIQRPADDQPDAKRGSMTGWFEVREEKEDHLVCRRFHEDGTVGETDVLVAKPRMLRHDPKYYLQVASMTTTDPDAVDVTFDGDTADESWQVTLSYLPSATAGTKTPSVIHAVRSRLAREVEVDGEPVRWLDANLDARAWAVAP